MFLVISEVFAKNNFLTLFIIVQLVDVSAAQDAEAGDGTTSVVVITGALLGAAEKLLAKGIHPMIIAESFQRAARRAVEVLLDMANPISLSNKEALIKAASTSLNSKIVSQFSNLLSPMVVDAVLKVIDPDTATNVNLNNIRLIKKLAELSKTPSLLMAWS